MKIEVAYSASSNISYRGTWEFDVDDEDWAESTEDEREKLIDEWVQERIANDISWYVKE